MTTATSDQHVHGEHADHSERAPDGIMQAVKRGMVQRCPACGTGRLFRAYLKVADECPECHEEMHHHRADDLPAYIVISIVGHIVVSLVLIVETAFSPSYAVHLALWPALTIALTFLMIQPVKGAVVALQWFMGMDGFEPARKRRDLAAARAVYSRTN